MDRLTKSAKVLAQQNRAKEVLAKMPKIWYLVDDHNNGVRVGRTDWPGDQFDIVLRDTFDKFKYVMDQMKMPVINMDEVDE